MKYHDSMITHFFALLLSVALFVGMWLCHELGRWFGRRELKRDPEATRTGTGVIDAGVFGLLGLLLAFAFAGAATRLDTRRQIITEEANAIGTAWLRLDLLPPDQQPALRDLFRKYLDARISGYDKIPDLDAAEIEFQRANQLQNEIWKGAVKASQSASNPQISVLVLPPINDMIDITSVRSNATRAHVPGIIIVLLFSAALLSAVLASYSGADKPRRKLHIVVFSTIIAITIYVILDLDYPRVGLIRETSSDQALIQLRASMN